MAAAQPARSHAGTGCLPAGLRGGTGAAFPYTLSAKDRAILGHTYGVFGYEKLSADELGLREMLSPDGVTKARKSALERLRSRYPGSGLHLWRDVYHALKDISDI